MRGGNINKEQEPQLYQVDDQEWLLSIIANIDQVDRQIESLVRRRSALEDLINRYQTGKQLGMSVRCLTDGSQLAVAVEPKGEMGFNK